MSAPSPTFGKYRIVRSLATGGMAEIFLAKQLGPAGFEKAVVVKRVLPHLSRDSDFVQMFLDEARLAARFSHPNIVQIFDFGETDGSFYLAMEYLSGEDLAALVRVCKAKGQPVPSQIAALIIAGACEGLHYAHTFVDEVGRPMNVVHRDVSPSNILVTYQGMVKILDFGIAKAEGKLLHTKTGVLKGKAMYMSPEQVTGKELDGRSDVFALGAVLYELVTGVRVFHRPNELAILNAVMAEPIVPPRQRRPELSPHMNDIIMKALERDRDRRQQSAAELRKDLDDFISARTYSPATNQLQHWMHELLGDAAVAERSKIPVTDPGLLAPAGATNLVAAPSTGSLTEQEIPLTLDDVVEPDPTRDLSPSPGSKPALRIAARARSRGLLVGALGGVTVGLAAVAFVLATRAPAADPIPPAPAPPAAATPENRLLAPGYGLQEARGAPSLQGDPAPRLKPEAGSPEPSSPTATPTPTPTATATATPTPTPPSTPPAADEAQAARYPTPTPAAQPGATSKGSGGRDRGGKRPAASGGGTGTLDVNCLPWCRIYVDGVDTGLTSPASGISLRTGKHRLRVVNPPTGRAEERDVEIAPGTTTRQVVRL